MVNKMPREKPTFAAITPDGLFPLMVTYFDGPRRPIGEFLPEPHAYMFRQYTKIDVLEQYAYRKERTLFDRLGAGAYVHPDDPYAHYEEHTILTIAPLQQPDNPDLAVLLDIRTDSGSGGGVEEFIQLAPAMSPSELEAWMADYCPFFPFRESSIPLKREQYEHRIEVPALEALGRKDAKTRRSTLFERYMELARPPSSQLHDIGRFLCAAMLAYSK